MTTLSLSHARANLPKIVKNVDENFERVTITVNGELKATVIAPQEIEAYEETIHTLSDEEAVKALIKAEKEWQENKVHTHEDVFA